MKINWNLIKKDIKQNKEGLIAGAVIGLLAAHYTISQGVDLTSVAEAGKGLLDTVMARKSAIEVATTKVYMTFSFFGAGIGYLIDKFMPEKKKKVTRKRR